MKKFLFTANCVFFAEDLDDVFKKLELHFKNLLEGEENEDSWYVGEMHIEPIKQEEVINMPCKGGKKKGGKKGGK